MQSKKDRLGFEVMPDLNEQGLGKIFDARPPTRTSKLKYWLILGIFALLAGLSYFVYAKYFTPISEDTRDTRIPDIAVDQSTGNLDSDKDGLTELEESRLATSPAKADTDGDGLADGDEANVYKTDPLLYDTDSDTFDDGQEVSRGFSPLVKSEQKAPPEEFKKWTDAIAKYGLHEPTPATLKLKAAASDAKPGTTYENKNFGYFITVPSVLATREAADGRNVGIYVKDTTPDPDINFDPIFLTAAVKVPGQTLQGWVDSQYLVGNYREIRDINVGSLPGIELLGMPQEDECVSNRTLFAKDNSVIILTWRCVSVAAFAQYYDQIVKSFQFK